MTNCRLTRYPTLYDFLSSNKEMLVQCLISLKTENGIDIMNEHIELSLSQSRGYKLEFFSPVLVDLRMKHLTSETD